MSTDGEGDLELWLAWKRVNEVVKGRILADMLQHGSLTEPEFTVLAHIDDARGTIRQNALAAAAGWDRTRLSHLLKRMEDRGYLSRTKLRNGVEVTLLPAGREAFESLHQPLASAVREHFTSRLDPDQRAAIGSLTKALND
ncbi:MarR family winged helix-turn-helix transcriptional regulator [Nesterenkonia ebinurensis]|uniref:MarR family winged helix-turn-helix transcriptional regulator n=1 Tax=Nesterenkonia ebinurensis TaxID=2608252 RepID=UPI00168B5A20|nr:MarR family transcriptional regulator [Nesterenkonia ebinurensis]